MSKMVVKDQEENQEETTSLRSILKHPGLLVLSDMHKHKAHKEKKNISH